jgi:hypothetical protein
MRPHLNQYLGYWPQMTSVYLSPPAINQSNKQNTKHKQTRSWSLNHSNIRNFKKLRWSNRWNRVNFWKLHENVSQGGGSNEQVKELPRSDLWSWEKYFWCDYWQNPEKKIEKKWIQMKNVEVFGRYIESTCLYTNEKDPQRWKNGFWNIKGEVTRNMILVSSK